MSDVGRTQASCSLAAEFRLITIMLPWQQVSLSTHFTPGTVLSSSFNPPNHPIPMSQLRRLRFREDKGTYPR